MNILAIDTATECCSVALIFEDNLSERQEISPTGHSRLVLGMVESLLQHRDVELVDLDAIAVDIGPGSFTGLRIGIGVTQGLSFAAGLPVFGISSLAALAAPFENQIVIPAIDARMEQIYWSLFDNQLINPLLLEPAVTAPQAMVESLLSFELRTKRENDVGTAENIIAVGSGWDSYCVVLPETLGDRVVQIVPGQFPDAAEIAKLANLKLVSEAITPIELVAAYVRNDIVKSTAAVSTGVSKVP